MKFLILFKAAFFIFALNSYEQNNLAIFKVKKQAIDRLFEKAIKQNSKSIKVWVKIKGHKNLTRVYNGNWPDNIDYTYNVFKDTVNSISLVFASPTSESGDWDISYIHYFDSQGRTIAFERRTGFFNSECTRDAAHETICIYYDTAFKQIDKTYKLTDSRGKNLIKSKCIFNYDFTDYNIYRNINDCLKGYNIKL